MVGIDAGKGTDVADIARNDRCSVGTAESGGKWRREGESMGCVASNEIVY